MEKIKIFLANRGHCSADDAVLMGEWVKLPIPQGKLEQVLARLAINAEHGEYIISDFDTTMPNLKISEYTSISEINALAEALERLSEWEYTKLCAILEIEYEATEKVVQAYLAELCHFDLIPEVDSEMSLGEFCSECSGIFTNMPDIIREFFDFEKYGKFVHENGLGTFTSYGYLEDRR